MLSDQMELFGCILSQIFDSHLKNINSELFSLITRLLVHETCPQVGCLINIDVRINVRVFCFILFLLDVLVTFIFFSYLNLDESSINNIIVFELLVAFQNSDFTFSDGFHQIAIFSKKIDYLRSDVLNSSGVVCQQFEGFSED